jgi:hypothetical protein
MAKEAINNIKLSTAMRDFGPSRRMANHSGILQIERFNERSEVIRIMAF